ncbi:glycosyltransferase family 2 protein [Nitrosomonas oligotropha]|uniref:glycosyltransferase family 2 protein n=1 Tax=Nitrosomonas oligotropha TaxID=42354 RepID=UPI001C409BFE|nr:glycosyltransferase family 2 protein [Nitrosomonas oligotropha]
MKPVISIVTAVFNRADTIEQALHSVHTQTWRYIEHVVIDGGSTDGTVQILNGWREMISVLISEPDDGIYDALNKGFSRSTGDIIGLMHSDDFYANEQVLERVAKAFADPTVDAVYGDLDYVVKDEPSRIIRKWRSGIYKRSKLAWGWMPPHPTLYLRRRVIDEWGVFDTHFRIAADYDAILRYLALGKIRLAYIPEVLVKMRVGGESNRSLSRILLKSREDLYALKKNGVGGIGALVWKNLSKIRQFF